jgi:membrane dipeptidase
MLWSRDVTRINLMRTTALGCCTLAVAGLLACSSTPPAPPPTVEQLASALARDSIIVDTHIDVPIRVAMSGDDVTQATSGGTFDYPRARAGGLDVAFMSIFIPASIDESGGGRAFADKLIDEVDDIVQRAPTEFALATCVADVRRNVAAGRISLPMGMENGGPFGAGDDAPAHFYARGIRYVTLAHAKSNAFSDSSYDKERRWGGLSPAGRDLVKQLNDLGIMVDVSHISDAAFWKVIATSAAPVIASHSAARHFVPDFERDISDEMIHALAAHGGVVQVNFGSSFVTPTARAWADAFDAAAKAYQEQQHIAPESDAAKAFAKSYRDDHPFPYATVEDVVDHIDHIAKLVGVDHVGLGSDFDGVGDTLPDGLKDASMYPNLIAGLLKRGYTPQQIKLVLGENLLRVWSAVEALARHRGSHVQCVGR